MDFVLIRVDDWYVIRRRSEVDLTKYCPVYGGTHKECRQKAIQLNIQTVIDSPKKFQLNLEEN